MSAGNRARCIQSVKNWNEVFPIGTVVIFEGKKVKTESHAGIGLKDEPGVFLEGVEELVPLNRLEIPGWERTTKKQKTPVSNG